MDTLQYVSFDMPSNNTCQWKFYCTDHRYVDMFH